MYPFSSRVCTSYCPVGSLLDSDIAGLGVFIAFLASPIIAIVAIAIGYLTSSIDEREISSLDTALISKTRTAHSKITPSSSRRRQLRQYAFERFILSLSDQQLATGIAILMAVYVKRNSINVASFHIAFRLAWLSCTTHLSTLTVLRQYFRAHPAVRNMRLGAMMLMLFMLLPAIAISYAYNLRPENSFRSLQCALKDMTFRRDTVKSTASILFSGICRIIWALIVYTNRIVFLYTDYPRGARSWMYRFALNRLKINPKENIHQDKAIRGLASLHNPTAWPALRFLKAIIVLSNFAFAELVGSFLWEIVWLLFVNTYGIASTFVWRTLTFQYVTFCGLNIENSAGSMGFGQIVALVLLSLPILAAGGAYLEFRGDTNVVSASSHRTPPEDSPQTQTHMEQHSGLDSDPGCKDTHTSIRGFTSSGPNHYATDTAGAIQSLNAESTSQLPDIQIVNSGPDALPGKCIKENDEALTESVSVSCPDASSNNLNISTEVLYKSTAVKALLIGLVLFWLGISQVAAIILPQWTHAPSSEIARILLVFILAFLLSIRGFTEVKEVREAYVKKRIGHVNSTNPA